MVGAAVTWPPKGDNDTMTMRPFVLPPEQRERALNVLGTQVTVLASNTATQSYGITLQQGDEGTGPPPHRHDWDEAFFVLKGVIEFVCDGKAATCTPGTLVHVPRGTVHGFTYGVGGGQMLEITGPGALAAQMFTAVDREVPAGPPDVSKVLEVLGRNGVTVPD
jgi:quercetin dioxygenase-like cupin family protein